MITYTKIGDAWGVRVTGTAEPGAQVTVTKRDGTTKTETVDAVISTRDGISICSIRQTPRASAPTHRSAGRMRTCSYCDRRVPADALCCGDGE